MVDKPRDAYMTMTFEFIRGSPAGFAHVEPLWFDIGGCVDSKLPAKPDAHFDYTSPVWTSGGVSGRVTFVAGHLHDGGTRLEVVRNGEVACVSVAEYGCEGGEVGKEMEMGMGMHISSMSTCQNAGRVELGDEWTVKAHYDTKLHAPMVNMDGSLEPIMGIALLYVVGTDGSKASEASTGQSKGLGKRWAA